MLQRCDPSHKTELVLTPGTPRRDVGAGAVRGLTSIRDNRGVSEPSKAPNADGSAALFHRAQQVSPGGVNSPVRAFRAVGGTPRFMAHGSGPFLTDVDDNRYVDLVCSWGPLIHGHAHPRVVEAVTEAARLGTSFGTPAAQEVMLAEEIVRRTSVDKVRLVTSGTEATMSAIRLARGFAGRELIVKFAGCYHGHVDSLLAEAGSGLATFAVPGTPGVPDSVTARTIVIPYNDRAAVDAVFAEHGDRIAALITEAAPGNMGAVAPAPGFNAFLAQTCRKHGAVFISDEVMTGFRVHRGGLWGLEQAQPRSAGWQADLVTFGKVMGGGFPAAAFGGSAEIMDLLAPVGPVYQAGTLAGNPVASAAGRVTLELADDAAYSRMDATAQTIKDLVSQALTDAGVRHVVQAAGNLFSVFFGRDEPVTDFASAQDQAPEAYRAFFHAMLESGVYLPPSSFEAWFVSTVHDDESLSMIEGGLPRAAEAAGRALAIR